MDIAELMVLLKEKSLAPNTKQLDSDARNLREAVRSKRNELSRLELLQWAVRASNQNDSYLTSRFLVDCSVTDIQMESHLITPTINNDAVQRSLDSLIKAIDQLVPNGMGVQQFVNLYCKIENEIHEITTANNVTLRETRKFKEEITAATDEIQQSDSKIITSLSSFLKSTTKEDKVWTLAVQKSLNDITEHQYEHIVADENKYNLLWDCYGKLNKLNVVLTDVKKNERYKMDVVSNDASKTSLIKQCWAAQATIKTLTKKIDVITRTT